MTPRQKTIGVNLGALGVLLAAAIAALVLMNGSFGAAQWAKTLRSGSPIRRGDAATALQALGEDGAPAIPALLDVLHAPDEISAAACAKALVEIDAQRAYAFASELIARHDGCGAALTPVEIDVFEGLGPVAWRAIPLLRGALGDRRRHVRSLIPALIDMGDYGPQVIAAILEDARDPVYSARKWDAMLAFDRLGERALPLRPELERLTSDPTPAVSFQARMILGNLDRRPAYSASGLSRFRMEDRPYQEYALDRLAKEGPRAAEAVPDIVAELGSRSTIVRFMATWTLAHIGSPARAALPPLRALGADHSSLVRDGAAEAIRTIEANP